MHTSVCLSRNIFTQAIVQSLVQHLIFEFELWQHCDVHLVLRLIALQRTLVGRFKPFVVETLGLTHFIDELLAVFSIIVSSQPIDSLPASDLSQLQDGHGSKLSPHGTRPALVADRSLATAVDALAAEMTALVREVTACEPTADAALLLARAAVCASSEAAALALLDSTTFLFVSSSLPPLQPEVAASLLQVALQPLMPNALNRLALAPQTSCRSLP